MPGRRFGDHSAPVSDSPGRSMVLSAQFSAAASNWSLSRSLCRLQLQCLSSTFFDESREWMSVAA